MDADVHGHVQCTLGILNTFPPLARIVKKMTDPTCEWIHIGCSYELLMPFLELLTSSDPHLTAEALPINVVMRLKQHTFTQNLPCLATIDPRRRIMQNMLLAGRVRRDSELQLETAFIEDHAKAALIRRIAMAEQCILELSKMLPHVDLGPVLFNASLADVIETDTP